MSSNSENSNEDYSPPRGNKRPRLSSEALAKLNADIDDLRYRLRKQKENFSLVLLHITKARRNIRNGLREVKNGIRSYYRHQNQHPSNNPSKPLDEKAMFGTSHQDSWVDSKLSDSDVDSNTYVRTKFNLDNSHVSDSDPEDADSLL